MTSLNRYITRDHWILLALTIVFIFLPLGLTSFQTKLALLILYWAYLGNSWNIMGGYAGQFSFGHAMFFGIGAYTSTVLLVDYNVSPWIGMLIGAGFAAVFGVLIGYLFFQFGLKGHFFALGTFALAEMLRLISGEMEILNTTIGIIIPPLPREAGDSWWRMQFQDTPLNYYYIILGLFVVGMLITIWMANSKLGYYLLAIREDEDAAAALGVNITRYKIASVALSGALAAVGGSFYVQESGFIEPAIAFGTAISIEILLRPIIGGTGTIWGPMAGALLLTPLAEFTREFVRTPPAFLSFIEGRAGIDVMFFGLLIIIVVIFMPDGIVGSGVKLWKRLRSGGKEKPAHKPTDETIGSRTQAVREEAKTGGD
ncbi:MAG: branched-chain amino acid ABC transporter permease [Chloroflexota bacterium]